MKTGKVYIGRSGMSHLIQRRLFYARAAAANGSASEQPDLISLVLMVNWREHISSDPKVMLGKPCFKGTRIPVDLILEKLAFGETEKDILKGYPRLSPESIKAALHFAVDSVRNDITYTE